MNSSSNTVDDFEIREAQPSEFREITKLAIQGWHATYQDMINKDFLQNLSEEDLLERRIKKLSEKDAFSIVAVYEDKIVGFCEFGTSRHLQYGQGEIYALYVQAAYQRMGMGRKLLEAARQRLISEDLMPCVVIVLVDNKIAQSLYDKLGFDNVDTTDLKIGERAYASKVYLFE